MAAIRFLRGMCSFVMIYHLGFAIYYRMGCSTFPFSYEYVRSANEMFVYNITWMGLWQGRIQGVAHWAMPPPPLVHFKAVANPELPLLKLIKIMNIFG